MYSRGEATMGVKHQVDKTVRMLRQICIIKLAPLSRRDKVDANYSNFLTEKGGCRFITPARHQRGDEMAYVRKVLRHQIAKNNVT